MHTVGIQNRSGVSCHISSALQVLLHALNEQQLQSFLHLSTFLKSKKSELEILSREAQDCCEETDFILHFGLFLAQIEKSQHDEDDESIDPTSLFNFLSFKLDSTEAGDASSSLRILMQMLQQSIDFICQTNKVIIDVKILDDFKALKKSLYESFWNGLMSHQISGSKSITEIDNVGIQHRVKTMRSKASKDRQLPTMITIPVNKNDAKGEPKNLVDSFNKLISQSQRIIGFDWEGLEETEYVQNKIDLGPVVSEDVNVNSLSLNDENQGQHASLENQLIQSKDSSSLSSSSSSSSSFSTSSSDSTSSDSSTESGWITEKKVWLKNVPNTLLFQLKRFEYKQGKTCVMTNRIEIPIDFHLYEEENESLRACANLDNNSSLSYTLKAAIVYTEQNPRSRNNKDDIGHYLTYLRKNQNEWIKVNDEKVSSLHVTSKENEIDETLKSDKTNDSKTKTVSWDQFLRVLGGLETEKGFWGAFVLMYERIKIK